ncbi:MAG: hypothetical protein ACSLE4_13100 [Methyloceanibacter sp.]|uniref:hypothetical protein n=1 Tax=Methyloceanibacter sp. TaxID=1965321 RepID=UPI003EE0DC59
MWKTILAVSFLSLGALTLAGCSDDESKSSFVVCESTYALCTTAKCEPADGSTDTVSCACDVKTGYSAGEKPCTGEAKTDKGTEISSRYYPIKSYAACDNDRPWAWCLDKPCVVDKDDPTKASCACTVTKNEGPYLVVTDTYTDSTCTTDLWSSATVKGANQLTDFLKTTSELKPYDIKVLNAPK